MPLEAECSQLKPSFNPEIRGTSLQSFTRGNSPVHFGRLKWALHVSRIIYRFTQLSYRTLKQYPELAQLCIQLLGGEIAYEGFVTRVKERIKGLLKGQLEKEFEKR